MEEIDLKELLYEIKKDFIFIILLTVICGAIGFIYQEFFVTPMYKSSTSLVLSKGSNLDSEASESTSITQSDINLNQKLVSTYAEIIKSRAVAKEVIEKLGLNMTEKSFISSISVNSKKDTELLEITVSNKDPKLSQKIVNCLPEIFAKKVDEIYNIKNVSVIDTAELPQEPYNINSIKSLFIFSFAGLCLALVIIFIKFYFNDTINNESDIEKCLGLPVLAVIPKYDEKNNFERKK